MILAMEARNLLFKGSCGRRLFSTTWSSRFPDHHISHQTYTSSPSSLDYTFTARPYNITSPDEDLA